MWRGRQLCLKVEKANAKPTHCIAAAALGNFGWFLMMLSFGRPRPRCRWKWSSRQMSKMGSPRLDLGLDAQNLGLDAHLPAELGLVYFPGREKRGLGSTWQQRPPQYPVFDRAVALMARSCGGPVAFRNLVRDPAALKAKLSQAPPQQVTTLQGLAEASWAP